MDGRLSAAELRHFAEKGWVLREGVFSAAQCAALREATDAELRHARQQADPEKLLGVVAGADESDGAHFGRLVVKGAVDTVAGAPTAQRADVFAQWARHPKILPALEQLLRASRHPRQPSVAQHSTTLSLRSSLSNAAAAVGLVRLAEKRRQSWRETVGASRAVRALACQCVTRQPG